MSSRSATPLTVTFMAIGWGLAKSLFGSTSLTSSSAPTLNVRSAVMPLAVRMRKSCSPRAASGSMWKVASTWPLGLASIFVALIPG